MEYSFFNSGEYSLYVRHIPSSKPTTKAAIFFPGESISVEGSSGIRLGSISYGEYLAKSGIEVFLIDTRGSGLSTPVPEQIFETSEEILKPTTVADFFDDIHASINYVKSQLGNNTEIHLVTYSLIGYFVMPFITLYPDAVTSIVTLNSGLPAAGKQNHFVDPTPGKPYKWASVETQRSRIMDAPPSGCNFLEDDDYNEIFDNLRKFQGTYNSELDAWKVPKKDWKIFMEPVKDIHTKYKFRSDARILFLASQYDTEVPWVNTKKLYDSTLAVKDFIVVPDCTHLCRWERARHLLYQWTTEFILK